MENIARIGIVGGGLAGLAAALTLATAGAEVELFESGELLGGRATTTGQIADKEVEDFRYVSFGCDTNFYALCRKVDAERCLERHSRIHLFGADGRHRDLHATPGLPAPLHLAASILRLSSLSFRERWSIIKALRELAAPLAEEDADLSVARWLRLHDQTPQAIDRFWTALLVSRLGCKLESASLIAARRLVIDRLLRNRMGYTLEILTKSFEEAIAKPIQRRLESLRAKVHLSAPVRLVLGSSDRCQGLLLEDGTMRPFDLVIVAVALRQASGLLGEGLRQVLPPASEIDAWSFQAFTGAHLWFDRPLTPLSHALLVEGVAQFILRRHPRASANVQRGDGFHYQVSTNPAMDLTDRSNDHIVEGVCQDLRRIWSTSRDVRLVRSQVIHHRQAQLSSTVDHDARRPTQETSVPNLFLAGDWTRTGLSSTMEGAVLSGNLAAEAVLRYLGRPAKIVAPELPPDWLARRLGIS